MSNVVPAKGNGQDGIHSLEGQSSGTHRGAEMIVRMCVRTAAGGTITVAGLSVMAAVWPGAATTATVAIGVIGGVATSAMGTAALYIRRVTG